VHVIWDWNGTLLHDLPVTVAAANAALARLGGGPIDAEGYRDHYTRPVHVFYGRILGRTLTEAEWLDSDGIWRSSYRALMADAALAADARAALEQVRHDPTASQSILSMWWHDDLAELVQRYAIDHYMTRIDGNDGTSGARKQGLLARHVAALGRARSAVVVVGDSMDDAHAAEANDIRCVLYDSGTHHRQALVATGHPVASTLVEALALAGL